MRQFYYKSLQLLQIASILLKNAAVITICVVYYKMRQYNPHELILNLTQEYFTIPKTGKSLATTFYPFSIKKMQIDLSHYGDIIKFHDL